MFSFLFKRKGSELITSSDNTVSLSSLIAQINHLKEENERKRLQIEALEKQVNQQQIQILTLKKYLRFSRISLINNKSFCVFRKNSMENTKLLAGNLIAKKSICSEMEFFTELSQPDEFMTNFSLFEEGYSCIHESGLNRSSFSLRELENGPSDKDNQNLNKFLCCVKLASPSIFKDIKNFVYEKIQLPSCYEIYDFIDGIHQKLEKSPKFIQSWGLFNEELLEDLVFEGIYSKIFNSEEDLFARSLQIREKLLVLQNIITPDLLEIPMKLRIPSVHLQLQNDLKKINERKSPKKKMKIISHLFLNLIKLYENDQENTQNDVLKPPNADDLFPLLVWIVLNANPENFYSNIEFISKYIRQNCLIGEDGYMLTNIRSAVFFLENLDGQGLKIGKLKVKPRQFDEIPIID